LLKNSLTKPYPKYILFVEFDNANDRLQKRLAKKARKIFEKYAASHQTETEEDKKAELWKIRQATSVILRHVEGGSRPLPVIEDGIVPVDRLEEYISGLYKLFERNHLQISLWGHVGEGNLHVQPFMDLAQVGDRQKVFRLMDEYYNMVIELGGSTSAGHNDGRLRSPYLEKLYGKDAYELFLKVKKIFDPHNILNPGVKTTNNTDSIKDLLRREYSNNLYNEMPRS